MVVYRCSAATGALVIVLGDVARVADNVLGYIGHSHAAGVLPVWVIGWLDGLAAKSPSTPPALPSEAVLRKARSASALVWLLVWLPTTMTSDARRTPQAGAQPPVAAELAVDEMPPALSEFAADSQSRPWPARTRVARSRQARIRLDAAARAR